MLNRPACVSQWLALTYETGGHGLIPAHAQVAGSVLSGGSGGS